MPVENTSFLSLTSQAFRDFAHFHTFSQLSVVGSGPQNASV